jgi:hypothetical protein
MISKFLIILLTYVLFSFINLNIKESVNKVENDTILWQENLYLEWSDFIGKADSVAFDKALTCVKIEFKSKQISNETKSIKIGTYFIKSCSWKKKNVNELLLIHEQNHFNLNEISARKIRKKILETKFLSMESSKAIIKKIFSDGLNSNFNEQEEYDLQTNHSMNKEEQLKWNAKIKHELNLLKGYRDAEFIIRIK